MGNGVGQEVVRTIIGSFLFPIRRTMSETVGVIGASKERQLVQLLNVSVSKLLLVSVIKFKNDCLILLSK